MQTGVIFIYLGFIYSREDLWIFLNNIKKIVLIRAYGITCETAGDRSLLFLVTIWITSVLLSYVVWLDSNIVCFHI